jgi:hypothetical protein
VLPNRNAVYAAWRFVANGLRTYRPLTSRNAFAGVAAIGRMPKWIASEIQRWAVGPLLDASRAPEIDRRNKADARVRSS